MTEDYVGFKWSWELCQALPQTKVPTKLWLDLLLALQANTKPIFLPARSKQRQMEPSCMKRRISVEQHSVVQARSPHCHRRQPSDLSLNTAQLHKSWHKRQERDGTAVQDSPCIRATDPRDNHVYYGWLGYWNCFTFTYIIVTLARNPRSQKLETAATYVTDRMRRVRSSMRFFETKSTVRARFTDTPHAKSSRGVSWKRQIGTRTYSRLENCKTIGRIMKRVPNNG